MNVAPGQYDDGVRWNSSVKSFRIGEKRQDRVEMTAGPGQYDVSRADKVTKTKVMTVNLSSSPERIDNFTS